MMEQKTALTVLDGLAVLAHEVELIVCTQDMNGRDLEPALIAQMVHNVESTLSELFGGFTTYQARGGWQTEAGLLIHEPNYIIQASAGESDFHNYNISQVLNVAGTVKKYLQQDAVSIKIDGKRYFI